MQDQEHDLNLIAALVEGRLGEAERTRVMEHLAECRECRSVFAQLGRAATDGSLEMEPRQPSRRWASTRGWLPIAASLAVATVAIRLFVGVPETVGPAQVSPTVEPPVVTDEDLLRKRSGGRLVAGKTFRMTDGEWVDQAFDPHGTVPVVDVRGLEARLALLARVPELAPYAELGDRVLVVHAGTVYRFAP